jgi:hypothetical protein
MSGLELPSELVGVVGMVMVMGNGKWWWIWLEGSMVAGRADGALLQFRVSRHVNKLVSYR